jgi:hypothetical protein
MRLIIFKNCIHVKEIDLVPGSYRIGRKDGCEILLEGKNISRHHAMLTITKDFAEIEDLSSSNGIAVDGKKIKKGKIGNNQNISLGEYKITLKVKSENHYKSKAIQALSTIFLIAGNRPYQSSLAIFGLFFLLLIGVAMTVIGDHYKTVFVKQEIERAVIIAKSLRDINSTAWQSAETSKFSLTEFEKMEGVVNLLLVDQFGRIQAPIDQLNKNINHPIIQQTLSTGKLSIERQTEGEYLICYPAVYTGSVKGAVLLLFKVRNPERITDNNWILAWGSLGFLAGSAMVFAILLVELFLKPWRVLLRSASSAIENVENKLHIIAGYKEIDNAKILFERLLVLRDFNGIPLAKVINDENKSCGMQPSGNEFQSIYSIAYYKNYEIFFVIEEQTHSIIYCNHGFKKLFNIGNNLEENIIELFTDPNILNSVSLVLNDNLEDHVISIDDVPYFIHKMKCKDNPDHVLVYFEKSND